MSNLHKETEPTFSAAFHRLAEARDEFASPDPQVSAAHAFFVAEHAAELDAMIVHERDYEYSVPALCSLIGGQHLIPLNGVPAERIQYALMREALQDDTDLAKIQASYEMLSQRKIAHATPKEHNACRPRAQLASCILMTMQADSIDGIFETVTRCAKVSKWGCGIGLSVHDIRAKGSPVHGTHGKSNGLVPMLKVFESTMRYVDQGGGKRRGSCAVYLEPWHADVEAFLAMIGSKGSPHELGPDLFYALWVPSLFMRRLEAGRTGRCSTPRARPGSPTSTARSSTRCTNGTRPRAAGPRRCALRR